MPTNNRPLKNTSDAESPTDEWLVSQVQRAFRRWGYIAWCNETVFGIEPDIVAKRYEFQNKPSDWLVCETMGWETDPVRAASVFRLVTLAFTCQAMPVLVYTTDLTDRAWHVAQAWDVRLLDLPDLQAESLPNLSYDRLFTQADGTERTIPIGDIRYSISEIFHRDADCVKTPGISFPEINPCYVLDRQGTDQYNHDR